MAIDLPNIASRLYGTPLLVSKPKLDTILSVLEPRLRDGNWPQGGEASKPQGVVPSAASQLEGVRRMDGGWYLTPEGVGVVPIVGSMVRRGSWIDAMSGLTSYANVEAMAYDALTDPSVKGVMLELDTPGGEAGGVFDLTRFIRASAKEVGKPVWAISNEMALSAGYALATAASKIWVTSTGRVGSIGVVAAHVDQSEKDKMDGRKFTFLFAGDRKVDGNPHEPLSPEAREDFMKDINSLYGMFVDLVAEGRGLSAQAIRDTEARTYMGADGVAVGLADRVGTFSDAVAALSEDMARPRAVSMGGPAARVSQNKELLTMGKPETQAEATENKEVDDAEDEAPGADAPVASNEDENPEGASADDGVDDKAAAAAAASAVSAKAAPGVVSVADAAALMEVAETAARAGVSLNASEAIKAGMSVADFQAKALREMAKKFEDQPTATANPVPHGSGASSWGAAFAKANPSANTSKE